jgi:hypothetical protein
MYTTVEVDTDIPTVDPENRKERLDSIYQCYIQGRVTPKPLMDG